MNTIWHVASSTVFVIYVATTNVPSSLVVCDIGCNFDPVFLRQVIMHSVMQAKASSRATSRKSMAIVLHAGCPFAAPSVKCLRKRSGIKL